MRLHRIYLATIAVLLLVIAAMAYKFIVAGSVQKTADGRVSIMLGPGERALMLAEMREFVSGLQRLAEALSRADMPAVASASRALGSARSHDVPAAMLGKLPLEFKTLAYRVHGGFDVIASDAERIGRPEHALAQLSQVLRQCAACHEAYQLQAATPGAQPYGPK